MFIFFLIYEKIILFLILSVLASAIMALNSILHFIIFKKRKKDILKKGLQSILNSIKRILTDIFLYINIIIKSFIIIYS